MTDLALDCGAVTDTGLVRGHNEDRYWIDPDRGAFLVVDGVGGQAAGERAAELAVIAIREAITAGAGVRDAIAAANNRIFAEAQGHSELDGMACVLTLALVSVEENAAQVTIGHVGDSRLYLIGDGWIRKVTSDHSPVGEIEDAGELTEEEAMAHPRRNEVFRDVGSSPRPADQEDFVEVRQCELRRDAAMLLCSDGLSDHLTSRGISAIVERYSGNAAEIARHLVDAANEAGGRDNITAVFVAGAEFRGRGRTTRARLGVTRVRLRRGVLGGRLAFLSYGLLIGMLLWAILRIRG
jgi:serine/threonine protein phosphatase PrpC